MNPFLTIVFWLLAIAASIAVTYVLALAVGMMKAIFLLFELALTVVWLWAAFWQFSLMREPGSDGGTFIGGLLFLVFGVLIHPAYLHVRFLRHRPTSWATHANSVHPPIRRNIVGTGRPPVSGPCCHYALPGRSRTREKPSVDG